MNERINLPDIADLLVEKHEMEKKDAELFVRDMFELIEESLATEKYVKIKGLGTFKLTEVDARESVDVNTGERIEIQGHTKVSFTPDTTMKELVNKPFSHFETVVLNDGVELEDLVEAEVAIVEAETPEAVTTCESPQEAAVVSSMEESNQEVVEEPVSVPQEEVVEVELQSEVPVVVDAVQPEVPETVEEIGRMEEQQEKKSVEIPEEEKPAVFENLKQEEVPLPNVSQSKEKNIIRVLWGVIAVLLFIILFGCYWLFIRTESSSENVVVVVPEMKQDMVEETRKDTLVVEEKSDTILLKVPVATTDFQEYRSDRVAALADTLEYRIVGTMETYTLQNGESIIKVSVKFFGSKMFWPYIVKHNRDVIKNADNISAGTQIKIPKLVRSN